MKLKKIVTLLLWSFCWLIGLATTTWAKIPLPELVLDDKIYNPALATILFYASGATSADMLQLPVAKLGSSDKLVLEFDEMGNQYHNYNFYLIHCNQDWKRSQLMDAEFAPEFNDYNMENYEVSLNTRQSYVHYWLRVPASKVSGNFVVVVYKDGNRKDIVLTRRFIVYESKVTIVPDIKFSLDPAARYTHQQIDFTLNYRGLQMISPAQEIKIVIRQNSRWDNAIIGLKPLYIRDEDKILDYHLYTMANNFLGGNEFRNFDIRSLRFQGQSVKGLRFDNQGADAWLLPDKPRNSQSYTQYLDINGRFVIENFETKLGATEADYVKVHFELQASAPYTGKVYVYGLLSDWQTKPNFEMRYNATEKKYEAAILLKQGYYDYEYVLMPDAQTAANLDAQPNTTAIEGSYNMTGNKYEIMVYFRPIGARADQLLGYLIHDYFGRGR